MTTIIRRYNINGTKTKLILDVHWQDFKGNESPYLSIDCRVITSNMALSGDKLESALTHIKSIDSDVKTLLDNKSSYKDRGFDCHFIANGLYFVNQHRRHIATTARTKEEIKDLAKQLFIDFCYDYNKSNRSVYGINEWSSWKFESAVVEKLLVHKDSFDKYWNYDYVMRGSDSNLFLYFLYYISGHRYTFYKEQLVPLYQDRYKKRYTAICGVLKGIMHLRDQYPVAPSEREIMSRDKLKDLLKTDNDNLLNTIIARVTTEIDLYNTLDSNKPFDINLTQLIEVTEQLNIETKTK